MQKHDAERKGLRILVVDDNSDVASATSMLLKLVGHMTHMAHNGRDAIVAATKDRYDVVLLDLNMPVMDGFKAARILGQLQPAPKLIAHSACDDPEARERTSALGFCAHLTKPVSLDLLQATLGRHCQPEPPEATAERNISDPRPLLAVPKAD